jgi:hypothetical protein
MIHFFKAFSSHHLYFQKVKKGVYYLENSQWRSHPACKEGSLLYAEAMNFKDALHIFHKKGSIFKEFLLLYYKCSDLECDA